jgi:hypothetical protein
MIHILFLAFVIVTIAFLLHFFDWLEGRGIKAPKSEYGDLFEQTRRWHSDDRH